MNLQTRLGHAILAARRLFNAIDLKIFGAAVSLIAFICLWALMSSSFLPSRYDLKPGDVAQDLIQSPRTLTFENKAETSRLKQQAQDQVNNVYMFDASVLPRVDDNINNFFDDVSSIVIQEQTAAQGVHEIRCVGSGGSGFVDDISDAAQGSDQGIAQFFAQVVNMNLDRIAFHFLAPAIEAAFQLIAGLNPANVEHELV